MNAANSVRALAPLRLRPMGVADMLDAAVHIYRERFVKLVTLTALVLVPLSALDLAVRTTLIIPLVSPSQSLFDTSADPAAVWSGQGLNLLISLVSAIVTYGLLVPALAWAAGQSYMGHPFTLGAAYRLAWRRLPVTAALVLLYLAGSLVLLAAWLVPCVGWLGAPVVWLYATVNILTLAAPVVMLENGNLTVSLKRCWSLTRSNFWRACGLLVGLSLFGAAITSGPSILTGLLVVLLAEHLALAASINIGLQTLINLVYMPIWGIGLTLLYYDARVRYEALDLELLAGLTPQPEAGALKITWFDKSDWKTLIILFGLMLVPPAALAGLYFLLAALGALLTLAGA